MKVSLKLLNEYLDLSNIKVEDLVNIVTTSGVEIENVEHLAIGDHLTIGYVKSCEAHPDSDHLHVCKVDIGTGIDANIVCGAPNVKAGQKVIVALPGANLPAKDIVIQKGVIRGVASEGMICSLLELGVDEKYLSEESKTGIEVLSEDAPIGHKDPLNYLGLDDTLLELKPTPNRGDVLSFISFVYEVSAVLNIPLKKDLEDIKLNNLVKSSYKAESKTSKCPRFAIRGVKGVKTKPSPKWLKDALMGFGIRSINNIVDISNYVMVITGQPLHMYDADKLEGNTFTIKDDYSGKFTALDEQTYDLVKGDILITTGSKMGCLAGVMGGNDTKIDDNSTNIVIEAVEFDSVQIRTTARRLLLLSEAATRFIRGIDYTRSYYALDLAAKMLIELADANSVEEITSTGDFTPINNKVSLSVKECNSLLGTSFNSNDIKEVFDRLKFKYSLDNDTFMVNVPTYRSDITIKEDLIEEVIRIKGFENLSCTNPTEFTVGGYTDTQHKRRLIREHLVEQGLYETLTYSLEHKKHNGDFNVLSVNNKVEPISIMTPITEDHEVLRQSLIPSLLLAIKSNNARNNYDVPLFENSKVYYSNAEHELLGIAISGHINNVKWLKNKEVDFYTLKGLVISILELLGIEDTRYSISRVEENNKYYHPGRSAYIKTGNTIWGVIGEIHPNMAKKYDVKNTYVAELDMDYIYNTKTSKIKFTSPSIYPGASRDIAIIVKEDILTGDLIKTIKKNGKSIVKSAEVFDIYQGENLEKGYKSVAITINYEDSKKTLKDDEVNAVHNAIVEALEKTHQAKLRG